MTVNTNSGFDAASRAGAYGVMALAELQLRSGTVRYTTWPVNVQTMGQSWLGLGNLGSIGEMHESEDGAAEKLTLTLSPIDVGTRALALGDPADYQDRRVRIWIALVDAATLQITGQPVLRFVGVMDQMKIERDGTTASIGMDCRTASYDVRSNPAALRMNHAQHQARHPGEMGFSYLTSIIGNPAVWVGKWLQANLQYRQLLGVGSQMNADLDAFIEARRALRFGYFDNDCATFAADWVREVRGTDPLAPLRAEGGVLEPRRLLTALRHVRAAGGFEAAANALLGPSKPGLCAQRGDVVLARSGGRIGRVSGHCFGICTGTHVAALGMDRMTFLPLTAAVAAWRSACAA